MPAHMARAGIPRMTDANLRAFAAFQQEQRCKTSAR
jgi:hypothetical protein